MENNGLMQMDADIVLVFKSPEGELLEIETKINELFEYGSDYFIEELEPECTSSGCHNESQNFCECPGIYENHSFEGFRFVSHSPAIEQPDTLQPGDWFQSTEEEYRHVLKLASDNMIYLMTQKAIDLNHLSVCKSRYTNKLLLGFLNCETHLTPEEFLRRAENTI